MADYHSFDGHGVDVAVNRADSLDKECLAYVADNPGCRVVDLGSGAGGQSIRMVDAGAIVTAVDQFDFSEQFKSSGYSDDQLRFIMGNLSDVATLLLGHKFQMAICQRTIHYLPYQTALQFLTELQSMVTNKLFISVTGVGSLVGDTYPAAGIALADRFTALTELGQEMFSITGSVCLYSEEEFRQLLTDAGWQVDSCRVTAFGNIQAICNNQTS